MKTIYKYQLDVTDVQTLHIPKNSKILNIQTQKNTPCI